MWTGKDAKSGKGNGTGNKSIKNRASVQVDNNASKGKGIATGKKRIRDRCVDR